MSTFNPKIIRFDIQALRAFAVIAVVVFHAFPNQFPGGYLGVDMFFVISGFVVTPLIARIFDQQKVDLKTRVSELSRFFYRRFLRLAPPLALTISLSSVLFVLLAPPSVHHMFASQALAALLLVGNVGADKFSGNYFFPTPNPMIHTWSLSVEEQIYIALPLLLLALFQKKWKKPKTVILASLLALILLSFTAFEIPSILSPLYAASGLGLDSNFSFYSPLERVWEFAAGGVTWAASLKTRGQRSKIFFVATPLSLALLAASLFSPLHIANNIVTPVVVWSTAVAIQSRSLSRLPVGLGSIASWLGDRSYSIYLWHMPLIFLAVWSKALVLPLENGKTLLIFIALVLTAFLASLSYKLLEKNRYSEYSKPINFKRMSLLALRNLGIPLALLMLIFQGLNSNYWGLDRNTTVPAYAGFIDSNCARDSDGGVPCEYGVADARGTALLIGDSHAGMLSQAFIDAAHKNKLNAVVWTHSGCPVLLNGRPEEFKASCIGSNIAMVKWLEGHQPEFVVLSQYIRSTSPLTDLVMAAKEIGKYAQRKILITNPPIFPDVDDFMVARPMIMKPYEPAKALPKKLMNSRDSEASNQFKESLSHIGFQTLDPQSAFCSTTTCSRFSKGQWLYRDDNHLSIAGARLLTKSISQLFASRQN